MDLQKYIDDIKNYDPNYDEKAAKKIASNLRLVMYNKDSCYVAATQKSEMDLVVKNFGIKKLKAKPEDAEKAVKKVAELMHNEHDKNRITFYYLVAKELGKLKQFHS